MSDWKPNLYLSFEKERTQPAIDLSMRIGVDSPKRIIDIGCGPGNSTNILRRRWPDAEIIGLDNSQAMIEQAANNYHNINWVLADAAGDLSKYGSFDIVFSNAAIQWIPEQELLMKSMFGLLNKNGVLAVQVPYTNDMPVHIELKKLASSDKWIKSFMSLPRTHSVNTVDFYYNALSEMTDAVDLWVTNYHHVMGSHADIVKWYGSTGLRPYVDCINDESIKKEFLYDFEYALKKAYPMQNNKKVLFPFTRIFFIASNL